MFPWASKGIHRHNWLLLYVLCFGADATWNRSETLWTQVTLASDLKHLDCEYLGSYALNPDDLFPDTCYSRALIKGADSFDAKPDATKCYFKKCGSFADIKFADKYTTGSSYTVLTNAFTQITRAEDNHHTDCDDLGSYELDSSDVFPMSCSSRAIILGGDTFDVKADLSKCYFKKCGSLSNIKFGSKYQAEASFTLLAKGWTQITLAADNKHLDCDYLGSYELSASDDFPEACFSNAMIKGADSFDAKPDNSKCYFKKCASLVDIKFADKYTIGNSFTLLTDGFKQLTLAADTVHTDCEYIDSYELVLGDSFPMACYSKAFILGADTFDAKPDQSKCYFKKCGAFVDIRFANKFTTGSSYTLLVGGWLQITRATEWHADCDYIGSYDLAPTDPFPETCYSKVLLAGGDTFDAMSDGSKCSVKKCKTWVDIKFAANSASVDSFTLLFPRGDVQEWPFCDPATCIVDMNLYWTAELRGAQLPADTSGGLCDPEAFVDSQGAPCFGGHAKRLTFINEEKARLAAQNQTAVFFDLGGSGFGSPMFQLPGYPVGRIPSILMNELPYDFCGFSSSDFLSRGLTPEETLEFVESFGNRQCPWLMSNADFIGEFSALNANLVKYKTITTRSDKKIGFFYMVPHTYNRAFQFGLDAMHVDGNSLAEFLVRDKSSELATSIYKYQQINLTAFRERFVQLAGRWRQFGSEWHDLYWATTVINVDILDAVEQMRQAHPDVSTMVLLVGSFGERSDQIHWMLEYGPFDVILGALGPSIGSSSSALIYESKTHRKTRLFATSRTSMGIGKLRVRVGEKGVSMFDFHSDFSIPDVVPDPNLTVKMSKLYEPVRNLNSQPYGIITAPLIGNTRGGEPDSAFCLCCYTDCPHGNIIGAAILWQARKLGHKPTFSFSNLGGVRSPLFGNASTGAVSIGDCERTLAFKNPLYLYTASGEHIFETLSSFIVSGEPGFISGGVRAAFYEPCWDYVNHSSPYYHVKEVPPGYPNELADCKSSLGYNDAETAISVTDMQFEIVDYNQCDNAQDYTTCTTKGWERLARGNIYTFVTSEYIGNTFVGATSAGIQILTEPQALCNYIKATSPLHVDSWKEYAERGSVRYASAQEGWHAGNRNPSVVSPEVMILTQRCPDGKTLLNGICELCPLGRESTTADARDKCDKCEKGRYGDETGLASCKSCPGGRFQNESGRTFCTMCPSGFHSGVAWQFCSRCLVGFYSPAGQDECFACPRGKFSDISGSSACKRCPTGKVANDDRCQYCPINTAPSSDGSTCEQCSQKHFAKMGDSECTSCTFFQIVNEQRDDCEINVFRVSGLILSVLLVLVVVMYYPVLKCRRARASKGIIQLLRGPEKKLPEKLETALRLVRRLGMKDLQKNIQKQIGVQQRKYVDFDAIQQIVEEGDITLVRGTWLSQQTGSNRFRRQQILPVQAFWKAHALHRQINMISIVAVSYCWLHKVHPDPFGEHYKIIRDAVVIRLLVDGPGQITNIALFFDYMSMPQKGECGNLDDPDPGAERTSEEYAAFKRGLSVVNVFYANQFTDTWILQSVPSWVDRCYDERAWPTFEKCVSSLIKDRRNYTIIDADIVKRGSLYDDQSQQSRMAPYPPEDFAKMLQSKIVTSGKDLKFLVDEYTKTFADVIGNAAVLWFVSLGWGDEEGKRIISILPCCDQLQELLLSDNCLSEEVAVMLAAASATCETLVSLDLSGNAFGTDAHDMIDEAWLAAGKLLQDLHLDRAVVEDFWRSGEDETSLNQVYGSGSRSLSERSHGSHSRKHLLEQLQASSSLHSDDGDAIASSNQEAQCSRDHMFDHAVTEERREICV